MLSQLSDFLGVNIDSIEILSSWFLSAAYKAKSWEMYYVVREIQKGMPWFEYHNEVLKSFSISHDMYDRAYEINKIKSYGVFNIDEKIFHVQDYRSWTVLFTWDLDENLVKKIAEKIAEIHLLWKKKISFFEKKTQQLLYRRSLREILVHHETLFSTYEHRLESCNNKIYLKNIFMELTKEYLEFMDFWTYERCTILHWDFWAWNIISHENDVSFIDFSRIPYGEPWIDVWTFIANLEMFSLSNKDTDFLRLKKIFLDTYIKITWDKDISKYLNLSRYRVLFLHLSPVLQQFLNRDTQKTMDIYDHYIELFIKWWLMDDSVTLMRIESLQKTTPTA